MHSQRTKKALQDRTGPADTLIVHFLVFYGSGSNGGSANGSWHRHAGPVYKPRSGVLRTLIELLVRSSRMECLHDSSSKDGVLSLVRLKQHRKTGASNSCDRHHYSIEGQALSSSLVDGSVLRGLKNAKCRSAWRIAQALRDTGHPIHHRKDQHNLLWTTFSRSAMVPGRYPSRTDLATS
jgi:hypothetical protein